jgi:hypothetical protein
MRSNASQKPFEIMTFSQSAGNAGSGKLRAKRLTTDRPRASACSLAAPMQNRTATGFGLSASVKEDPGVTATPFCRA